MAEQSAKNGCKILKHYPCKCYSMIIYTCIPQRLFFDVAETYFALRK